MSGQGITRRDVLRTAGIGLGAGVLAGVNLGSASADDFIVGTTLPTTTNTGVPAGTTLSNYAGDITVTTPGTVIRNRRVTGRIVVAAANVTIENCEVLGRGGTVNSALIDCVAAAVANCTIRFNTLHQAPATANEYHNAVVGHDYYAYRNQCYDVVDGFGVFNKYNSGAANVRIEGNHVDQLSFYAPDNAGNRPWTHNDGVQIQGNSAISIRGNRLVAKVSTRTGRGTSAYAPFVTGQVITFSPNTSRISDVTVDRNWLYGGSRSIIAIPGKFTVPAGWRLGTISNNRIQKPYSNDYIKLSPSYRAGTEAYVTGNKVVDLNTPITPVWADEPA